jgi:hypothetical protein
MDSVSHEKTPLPRTAREDLRPWRWAESLQSCTLLWMPVKLGDIPASQREWLLEFFTRLSAHLASTMTLREEYLMRMRVIDENEKLRQIFLDTMLKDTPLTGLSRRPGQQEVTKPSSTDVELFAKKKKEFLPYDHVPESSCWFLSREASKLRERYLGYGGLTVLFRQAEEKNDPVVAAESNYPLIIPKFLREDIRLAPLLKDYDPRNPSQIPSFLRVHPGMKQVFSSFNVDKMQEKSDSLLSSFRSLSKEIFGQDMTHDLKFEALAFIVPRLGSQDFFSHTEPEIRRWFDLFDIYINESQEDRGIIMACKDNLTSVIASVIKEMRDKGYRYWEG